MQVFDFRCMVMRWHTFAAVLIYYFVRHRPCCGRHVTVSPAVAVVCPASSKQQAK